MLSHSVSLVLALVCLWYAQVSEGHRPDLENVAYSKKVTLSSQYKHASHPGSNAVNGLLSDFAHSDQERFPWIRIDLEGRFLIHEIEVFVRTDCCANQLHDIDVKVGNSTRRMRMCGHVSGDTGLGGRMAVFCPTPTVGRYVQIQIVKGASNYMSPAEIVVWGKRVHYWLHSDHNF
ncbi:fucolectin-4-like [Crassostrea virginica]